jgi:16S rRNA (cytosine967-C5)-methyltransferase
LPNHLADPARQASLAALKIVREGGYANLGLKKVLAAARLSTADAAFTTELVYGVCRHLGTLDRIIETAGNRALRTLQPAVVDVLRLGAEQVLKMRVPAHAAVDASVRLAEQQIGKRTTGLVNAILRRIAERDWDDWVGLLSADCSELEALGLRTCHPDWIVEAYADLLPADELEAALEANNVAPSPTLVVRPGLMERSELLASGGEATPYSPWGVIRSGDPAGLAAIRDGRAGVQDEGSQLVAGVLAMVDAPAGPWLDICAGPGGKAALLTGLARAQGEVLIAADRHLHRAQLVVEALQAYGTTRNVPVVQNGTTGTFLAVQPVVAPVVVTDGRRPPWGSQFARILLDAPCTGLGALRRRPEARWRKSAADLAGLTALQGDLLLGAARSAAPGAMIAYVTCSPHRAETVDVINACPKSAGLEIIDASGLLPDLPNPVATTDPRFIQLWGHRHGTDAMFLALLRKA